MGRSKDLKQFVREGCTEGYVEIELKGRPRKDGTIKNLIVVRHMQAKNNASSFQLQGPFLTPRFESYRGILADLSITYAGQTVTQAAVTEAVRDLNVNVDNLWFVNIHITRDTELSGRAAVPFFLKIEWLPSLRLAVRIS